MHGAPCWSSARIGPSCHRRRARPPPRPGTRRRLRSAPGYLTLRLRTQGRGQERSHSPTRDSTELMESRRTMQPLRNFLETSTNLRGRPSLFGSGFPRRIDALLDLAPAPSCVAEQPEYAIPDGYASDEYSALHDFFGSSKLRVNNSSWGKLTEDGGTRWRLKIIWNPR